MLTELFKIHLPNDAMFDNKLVHTCYIILFDEHYGNRYKLGTNKGTTFVIHIVRYVNIIMNFITLDKKQ